MTRARRSAWIAACLVAAGISGARAANEGAAFLKLGSGARAAGMGSAFTAAADDATSARWNPAGLARMAHRELSASHTEWISDLRYDAVTAALPLTRGDTLALGAAYLSQGSLERRDAGGGLQGNFNASDAVASASLGHAFSPRLRAGLTAKVVEQAIDADKAKGLAFDAGVQAALSPRLNIGAAAFNLGRDMRFLSNSYHLPLGFSAGAEFKAAAGLTISADLAREVYAGKTSVRVGSEYRVFGGLALRAGYQASMGQGAVHAPSGDATLGSLNQFTGLGLGLGFRVAAFGVDYAMVPNDQLGATHHFTISSRF